MKDRQHSRNQYGRRTRKSRGRDQVRTPAVDFLQVDSTPLHVKDRDCEPTATWRPQSRGLNPSLYRLLAWGLLSPHLLRKM